MGKLSFGTTGLSYQVNRVDLSNRGAPKCPRCSNTVYFNEEKKALGKSWHSKCFTCVKCKKNLDSTSANGHDGEIYCNTCHRREFGPRGYGYAGGSAGLSTETSSRDILLGRSRNSSSSSSSLSSPKMPTSPTEVVAPHAMNGGVNKPKPVTQLIDKDNMECCPRCGKRVYFAEEVKALKRKWHKTCFKCANCDKMLDPGRCDGHQGEVYCHACYSRNFGPRGYGYGVGAGTLASDKDPHRFYKSSTLPARTRHTPMSSHYTAYQNGDTVRTDLNGARREWTDHADDIRYMKQLAAELDQFE